VKKEIPGSVYWSAVLKHDLAKQLQAMPGIAIYGEVYGWIQDLRYGHKPGVSSLALFDAMDLKTMRYLDYDAFVDVAKTLGVPTVPVLYRGPWKESLKAMAEGKSTLLGPSESVEHVREGFVGKPVKERFDDRICRVILKYHGEGYLTRKEKE
jgi:RNA ligase (TIGR02306 family)